MKDRCILPIALTGDKTKLSDTSLKQINQLSGARPAQLIYILISTWVVIIGAIWVAVTVDQILVSILVMFIVSSRQNVLALLVHEQAHCLGFKAKYGDPFVNFFAAYPLIVTSVENYAQVHLAHHKFFFSKDDPDIIRKSGEEWTYPKSLLQFAKIVLTDLLAMNLITLIKGKKVASDTEIFKRPRILPKWSQAVYFLAFMVLFTATHTWSVFLLYWCLPLLTFTQVFIRWGAICEHIYIPNAGVIESSPIIILSWWEKLLMPNLNFSLHPYHHFFPAVSCLNLPKVHQIFIDEGLVEENNLFYGNLSYLKFLLTGEAPRQSKSNS